MTWAPIDATVTALNLVQMRVETPGAVYPAGHLVWLDGEAQVVDDRTGTVYERLTVISVTQDGRRWRFHGNTERETLATWDVDGTSRPCCGATGAPIPKG